MAKVQKPSVSPEMIGQRPKKKSPVEDFAGALAVQSGKTIGNSQPARTASAEGQNQKAAIVGAAHGLGRRSPNHVLSSSLEGSSPAKPAEVLAVRSAAQGTPAGSLPKSSKAEQPAAAAAPQKLALADKLSSANPSVPQAPSSPDTVAAPKADAKPAARTTEHGADRTPRLDRFETKLSELKNDAAQELPRVTAGAAAAPTVQLGAAPVAARVVQASPLTPLQQVAQLIVSRAPESPGQTKAEITLYPEHLGTVQVSLTVDASGALSAVVAASQQALAVLDSSLADLRSSLQDAGFTLTDLDLRSNDQQHQESHSGSRSVLTLASSEAEQNSTTALIDGGQIVDVTL